MILLIVVLNSFLINFILPKNYQTVEKKPLLIILPLLAHLSFETRNRLNSCIKDQLPFYSLRIALRSKPVYLAYLNSKTVFPNTFAGILFINFRVVVATQVIMLKLRDTFSYERRGIWESFH